MFIPRVDGGAGVHTGIVASEVKRCGRLPPPRSTTLISLLHTSEALSNGHSLGRFAEHIASPGGVTFVRLEVQFNDYATTMPTDRGLGSFEACSMVEARNARISVCAWHRVSERSGRRRQNL